jgi:hypothetical protein
MAGERNGALELPRNEFGHLTLEVELRADVIVASAASVHCPLGSFNGRQAAATRDAVSRVVRVGVGEAARRGRSTAHGCGRGLQSARVIRVVLCRDERLGHARSLSQGSLVRTGNLRPKRRRAPPAVGQRAFELDHPGQQEALARGSVLLTPGLRDGDEFGHRSVGRSVDVALVAQRAPEAETTARRCTARPPAPVARDQGAQGRSRRRRTRVRGGPNRLPACIRSLRRPNAKFCCERSFTLAA